MDATILDLRYRTKDVLRAIDRGETVRMLYRGQLKATLAPILSPAEGSDKVLPKTEDQPLFGLWRGRDDMADPGSWVREIRKPRTVADKSGSVHRPSTRKLKVTFGPRTSDRRGAGWSAVDCLLHGTDSGRALEDRSLEFSDSASFRIYWSRRGRDCRSARSGPRHAGGRCSDCGDSY